MVSAASPSEGVSAALPMAGFDQESFRKVDNLLLDDDGRPKRTGTVWTASAHIVTAVIGSGVLSLAWSMAQLGWVAGPAVLFAFALVTGYTSVLLADCYRSPHPVTGNRNHTYNAAVKANLGGVQVWLCGLTQYTNLIGISIGYTITASISMVAIQRSNCFHKEGHDAHCHVSNNPYMIMFGVTQIFLSQVPDFDRLWWLSTVAAVMSFSYSSIGIILSFVKAFEGGHSHGSMGGIGVEVPFEVNKIWRIFRAFGDIAFAYSYSIVLIEIQDTLKSPPAENKTMKKASFIGVSTTTLFYIVSGCAGYAAFGANAPGNLLTGFGFYNPFWLVDLANVFIVVHLVGAYQVFCQPIFALVERWAVRTYPKSGFINTEHKVGIWGLSFTMFRLIWRTSFVVVTTVVSMLLPFFNDILGLLGALAFWPLTVHFPTQMYISQTKLRAWSPKWIMLKLLSLSCLCVSLVAFIGSIAGVVSDLKVYQPFKTEN